MARPYIFINLLVKEYLMFFIIFFFFEDKCGTLFSRNKIPNINLALTQVSDTALNPPPVVN